jgi:hypothetical protein
MFRGKKNYGIPKGKIEMVKGSVSVVNERLNEFLSVDKLLT